MNNLDSLETVLESLAQNEQRIDHLNGLAETLLYTDPNQSWIYAMEAKGLAVELEYLPGLAGIYKILGNINYSQGDFTNALENYMLSQKIFTELKDHTNIAKIYNNIANLYDAQKNVAEALDNYLKALDIFMELNDFNGQATIYMNMGVLFDRRGDPDSAIYYYQKSQLINQELKDERLSAITFGNLGYAYLGKEEFDKARIYFDQSLLQSQRLEDNEAIANAYTNLGELSLKEGEYDESLSFLKKSEDLSTVFGYKTYLVEDFRLIAKVYEKIGNYAEALEYHKKFKNLSDTIFTAAKDRALMEMEMRQKHETVMAELEQQNQIKEAELSAVQLKYYLLIAITGFSLIVMLIAAYYLRNRQEVSRKLKLQNEEILDQKKEIEKQKKIVSSANKDLREKNIRLNQLNKEKDYLLHVVAHDLKSPLNQMAGLTQVIALEKDRLSETQENCLEKIDIVSTRLSSMVDKILDIDAIEQKSQNLSLEETDLREIIGETVDDFESLAKNKNISIKTSLNGEFRLVKVDKHHVLQVFGNLLSNAIKFSPPNKDIFVNMIEEGKNIITEITDQGPGLTEDDKSKVFKKFQKLSAQPTGNEESNGLGLSIVKKYVDVMNGRVWVESEEGEGASFKVAFQKI